MRRIMMRAECPSSADGLANKTSFKQYFFVIAFALAFVICPALFGQATGSFSGTVLDKSGSSVPGASGHRHLYREPA